MENCCVARVRNLPPTILVSIILYNSAIIQYCRGNDPADDPIQNALDGFAHGLDAPDD